jgi:hypothetical protein
VPAHAKGNFMEIIFNGGYGKEGAAERQEALAAEERKARFLTPGGSLGGAGRD